MAAPQANPITELVNDLLERERRARGNITWNEFAQQIGVHYMTLWRWRHGRALGPAAEALLPLTRKHCPCQDHEPAAAEPA